MLRAPSRRWRGRARRPPRAPAPRRCRPRRPRPRSRTWLPFWRGQQADPPGRAACRPRARTLGRLDAVVDGVADEVHERVGELLDDELVELDVAARDLEGRSPCRPRARSCAPCAPACRRPGSSGTMRTSRMPLCSSSSLRSRLAVRAVQLAARSEVAALAALQALGDAPQATVFTSTSSPTTFMSRSSLRMSTRTVCDDGAERRPPAPLGRREARRRRRAAAVRAPGIEAGPGGRGAGAGAARRRPGRGRRAGARRRPRGGTVASPRPPGRRRRRCARRGARSRRGRSKAIVPGSPAPVDGSVEITSPIGLRRRVQVGEPRVEGARGRTPPAPGRATSPCAALARSRCSSYSVRTPRTSGSERDRVSGRPGRAAAASAVARRPLGEPRRRAAAVSGGPPDASSAMMRPKSSGASSSRSSAVRVERAAAHADLVEEVLERVGQAGHPLHPEHARRAP